MLSLLLTIAVADVVFPPPDDCPSGTRAATDHWGPHCVPTTCDGECGRGRVCVPTGFCVEDMERVVGTCDGPEDCTGEGVTCEVANRCVERGCGCSTTGVLPTVLFAFALLPLIGRRRVVTRR